MEIKDYKGIDFLHIILIIIFAITFYGNYSRGVERREICESVVDNLEQYSATATPLGKLVDKCEGYLGDSYYDEY